jgi:hypothetical protein
MVESMLDGLKQCARLHSALGHSFALAATASRAMRPETHILAGAKVWRGGFRERSGIRVMRLVRGSAAQWT